MTKIEYADGISKVIRARSLGLPLTTSALAMMSTIMSFRSLMAPKHSQSMSPVTKLE